MKVTEIDTIRADRFMYVRVATDEGITGLGELHPASGTGGTPYLPQAGVAYCSEYLVGKDPGPIENHWQHMFRRCLFRGGADAMAAIGAIDIALWDIKGKVLGKPIFELLGGPTRDKVRLYTHVGGNSTQEVVAQATARVEEGYTAVRMYPFGDFGRHDFEEGPGLESMSFSGMIRHAEARVAAVREAIGPDVDLIVDVVNRLTPAQAIAVGRALEPHRLFFFEDPIEPENMEAWREVAAKLPMPVAMGERLYTIYQFQDLLSHRGAAYVRPDLSLAGGISNVRKIAALAEAHYVEVAPHNPLSCVLTAACVHLDAAIHNVAIQEYPGDEYDSPKRDLVSRPLERVGGYLKVPDAPGLGIELNEEAFAHYPPVPYRRPPLIRPDGSLKDY